MTTMTNTTGRTVFGEGRATMTNPDNGQGDERRDGAAADPATPDIMQFPMEFPIKVMGKRVDGFADTVVGIIVRHAPDFDPATIELRSSKGGNYLSITATINAQSRSQLDDIYRALSGHPLVSVAL